MKNDYLRFTTSKTEVDLGFCELFKQIPIDCVQYERRTKLSFKRTLEWTFHHLISFTERILSASHAKLTGKEGKLKIIISSKKSHQEQLKK